MACISGPHSKISQLFHHLISNLGLFRAWKIKRWISGLFRTRGNPDSQWQVNWLAANRSTSYQRKQDVSSQQPSLTMHIQNMMTNHVQTVNVQNCTCIKWWKCNSRNGNWQASLIYTDTSNTAEYYNALSCITLQVAWTPGHVKFHHDLMYMTPYLFSTATLTLYPAFPLHSEKLNYTAKLTTN